MEEKLRKLLNEENENISKNYFSILFQGILIGLSVSYFNFGSILVGCILGYTFSDKISKKIVIEYLNQIKNFCKVE